MPSRPSLFGPLMWWELVRLARRGHATRARVLLLYALLVAVVGFAFVWSYWTTPSDPFRLLRGVAEPLPINEASRFASQLTLVLLEAQLLLVAAIAPAYGVAAVSEEKDRQTLSLLLTTELTDREIVWGKAAARVLFVLAAVASGIPVFMLTLLFGGVDVGFLAAGYALTIGTVVLSVGIGVSAACHTPDSRSALIRAYGQSAVLVGFALIPPFVMLSPFAVLVYYHMGLESAAMRVLCGFGYPVGQVAVACVLVAGATQSLRKAGRTAGPPSPSAFPEPPRGRVVLLPGPPETEPAPLPPVDEADPVLWKERHAGRTSPLQMPDRPVRLLGGMFTLLAVALFAAGGFQLVQRAVRALDPYEAERLLQRGGEPPDAAASMLVAAGVFAAGLYLLPLAVGVTGSVAGERFRGTLDSLLTTTLGRRKMLWSKLRAHAERGLVFAGGAAAALGAGFSADGGAWFGLAAVAAFASGVGLVIGLGAWLSVRCATPVQAFRLCMPAVVAVVGLPVLAWNITDWQDTTRPTELLAWTAGGFTVVGALTVVACGCGTRWPPRLALSSVAPVGSRLCRLRTGQLGSGRIASPGTGSCRLG